MVATKSPTIEARSARGIRSNKGKVASIWPNGDGSCGNFCPEKFSRIGRLMLGILDSENTGAVASKPSGE